MLLHWIWLAHRPGVNDCMKKALLQYFQDPEEIFFADGQALANIDGITREAVQGLLDRDLTDAQKILDICMRKNIRLLTYRDEAYPNRLRNIPDPPVLLYYIGNLPDIDGSPVIGIVGTRKASLYGLDVARRMGYQISSCGGIVVSGLAAGIDAKAMHGALLGGQCVIGVLGSGVDIVYPASNRALYEDTLRYGCILSEYAPGTPPNKWNFPKRNRIISGLSCGVLVVEAPERSGALITANQAAEQGRDVFVVPGTIDNAACVGSNRLMRDGAMPVGCGWDMLCEYEGMFPDKISRSNEGDAPVQPQEKLPLTEPENTAIRAHSENLKEKTTKKVIDKEQSAPYSDVNEPMPKLTDQEQTLVELLREGEWLVDDVIAETKMPAGKLLGLLTMLELKGVICRLPGKRVCLRSR